MAEAPTVLEGVRLARRLSVRQLVVESDCLQVINGLKLKEVGASDFHSIIDDILTYVSYFDVVFWSFVKRSSNKVALMLAHFQLVEFGCRCWLDTIRI